MAQIHRPLRIAAALVLVGVMLSGCSLFRSNRPPEPAEDTIAPPTPGQSQQGAQPETGSPSQPLAPSPRPPPPVRESHLSPATRSLVDQAHAQIAHGDLPAASSILDRALRIEPNNPLLWVELGRLRLAENDAHQAEGCGRKALVLASGDPAAQDKSARLLADALRAQQRNQEANEVERQLLK